MHTDNLSINPTLIDCHNCSKHEPPKFLGLHDEDECVFCNLLGHHVSTNSAEKCSSYPSFYFGPKPAELPPPPPEKELDEFPSLARLFDAECDEIESKIRMSEAKAEQIEEEKKEWVPQSNLDSKAFGFDDSNIAAGLRAIFDIMEGISKRLDEIEKKMPATKKHQTNSFLKKKKEEKMQRKLEKKNLKAAEDAAQAPNQVPNAGAPDGPTDQV